MLAESSSAIVWAGSASSVTHAEIKKSGKVLTK